MKKNHNNTNMITDLSYLILNSSSTIKKSIHYLTKNKKNILFLIDNKKKLVGTLTDGDLRSAFSKNLSSDSKVDTVMNKNPFFLYAGTKEKEIFSNLGEDYKLGEFKHIPILDRKKSY